VNSSASSLRVSSNVSQIATSFMPRWAPALWQNVYLDRRPLRQLESIVRLCLHLEFALN
jgi:hypothetical protein